MGAVVVVWGVLLGAIAFVRAQFRWLSGKEKYPGPVDAIHHDIARHLLLGLEFLIAADIMRTIVSPSLEEVVILGIIVAIRTVISYFLSLEIERVDKVKPGALRKD